MSKEQYIVISRDEDGDTSVHTYDSAEELLNDHIEEGYEDSFMKDVHEDFCDESGVEYWPTGTWIIKGKLVVPKAKKVTTKIVLDEDE